MLLRPFCSYRCRYSPRRGIRATLLRVRRSSSAARCHQTAPAVLQTASGLTDCGAHIRVLAAAARSATATCHAPRNRNRKRPSALRDLRSPPCSPAQSLSQ
ncbi:hypothetical protein NDU88_005535 [Pleurodeles waltl]|uniref:Uncharacterized protein n=1 Tax=Pleurodeles waltl TaxID=8319 RepID=A0AAV7VNT4_PLEWA|nr:hypothetical protein NDU88_005535 [Pleurodeles waltl]